MAKVPVYSDTSGVPIITIWEETPDGFFRRTNSRPLQSLKANIEDIGTSVGELMSQRYDRDERRWQSPTVRYFLGRPQSWYHFIRQMLKQRTMVVVTSPVMSARVMRFDAHELRIKPSASSAAIRLMINRYADALDIWQDKPSR